MKIKLLKIKNIASIEDATIDFDNGPLAQDPLFLITGDTGTGKTTILNAICLALYDKVPALNQIKAEDDREGLKINNTRQLVRKGTYSAEVVLTFEGNDGKQYKATWSAHRAKKSGVWQNISRELEVPDEKGRLTVYSKVKEIEALISNAVGLTFDQFTRTTMLAQGQFATFMKASDNDKSEILEKLTGTEIYTDIGKQVYLQFKEKEKEVMRLQALIQGANLLPADKKEEYTQSIANLAKDIERLEAQNAVVDKKLTWLTHQNSLQAQLQQKKSQQAAAKEREESDEIKQKRQVICNWRETTEVRRLMSENAQANTHINQLQDTLQALSGDSWHNVLDGIAWLETSLQKDLKEISELESVIDNQKVFEQVYNNAQRIEEIAKSIKRAVKERDEQQANASRWLVEKQKSIEAEGPLCDALDKITEKFNDKKAEAEAKEKETQQYDIKALGQQLNNLVAKQTTLQNAIAAVKEFQKCKTACEEAQTAEVEAEKAKALTINELDSLNKRLPAVTEEKTRCEAYLQGQMELKDHIRSLRERFADSHECPLCGNKDANLHTDDYIDQKLKTTQEAANEAKIQFDKINNAIAENKAKLKVQNAALQTAQRLAKDSREMLDKAQSAASSLAADFQESECLKKLENKTQDIEAQREQISRLLNLAQQKQEQLNKANKELEAIQKAQTEAEKKRDNQRQHTKDVEEKAKTASDLAAAASCDAQNFITEIIKLTICDTVDEDMLFADMLERGTGFRSITLESINDVVSYVVDNAKNYADDKTKLENTKRHASDQRLRLDNSNDAIKTLIERFGHDYEPTARVCHDLEGQIRALNAKVDTLNGQIKNERQKCQTTQARIDSWFDNNEISPEAVNEISKMTEDIIASCEVEVNNSKKALENADVEVGVISKQLEEHAHAKPELTEEDTVDTLSQIKETITHESKTANENKVQLETLLKCDAEAVVAQAGNQKKLQEITKVKNQWEILNKCFGGADGSQFKRVAQSYLLRVLLHKANYYLDMLTRRYRLDCEEGSLTINVVDAHQDNVVRNVGLLSGGEGFVVSLALALGLSAISKEKINVDTLFIDEGFGTLDKEILDTVINMLDRLHNHSGRRIGIISHVQDLKERIPTQVRLVRTGPSSSRVEVV